MIHLQLCSNTKKMLIVKSHSKLQKCFILGKVSRLTINTLKYLFCNYLGMGEVLLVGTMKGTFVPRDCVDITGPVAGYRGLIP